MDTQVRRLVQGKRCCSHSAVNLLGALLTLVQLIHCDTAVGFYIGVLMGFRRLLDVCCLTMKANTPTVDTSRFG
jgi:hypothetical protein